MKTVTRGEYRREDVGRRKKWQRRGRGHIEMERVSEWALRGVRGLGKERIRSHCRSRRVKGEVEMSAVGLVE